MTFAIFTWKSSASRDAESKLGRDKFFLFDVNMAGISMGEYSRRDDTRDSPLGWKMPVGWLLLFWILLSSGCCFLGKLSPAK